MPENQSDNYLTSFADHLNEQYGKRGKQAREKSEKEFNALIGMVIQELHEKDYLSFI